MRRPTRLSTEEVGRNRKASSHAPNPRGVRLSQAHTRSICVGGGRPVFGLWAPYLRTASHPESLQAVPQAKPAVAFVPITAAGQRRIFTGFPIIDARERRTCSGMSVP